jgi:hypothetical protein
MGLPWLACRLAHFHGKFRSFSYEPAEGISFKQRILGWLPDFLYVPTPGYVGQPQLCRKKVPF